MEKIPFYLFFILFLFCLSGCEFAGAETPHEETCCLTYSGEDLIGCSKVKTSLPPGKSTTVYLTFNQKFDPIKIEKNGIIISPKIEISASLIVGRYFIQYPFPIDDLPKFMFTPLKGKVFLSTLGGVFYYPPGAIEIYKFIRNLNGSLYWLEVFKNNPEITGIKEYPFKSPILLKDINNPLVIIRDRTEYYE